MGDPKPLSIRIPGTLLSRVHLKLINGIIEGNYVWRCNNNDDDDDDTVGHIGGRQVSG